MQSQTRTQRARRCSSRSRCSHIPRAGVNGFVTFSSEFFRNYRRKNGWQRRFRGSHEEPIPYKKLVVEAWIQKSEEEKETYRRLSQEVFDRRIAWMITKENKSSSHCQYLSSFLSKKSEEEMERYRCLGKEKMDRRRIARMAASNVNQSSVENINSFLETLSLSSSMLPGFPVAEALESGSVVPVM